MKTTLLLSALVIFSSCAVLRAVKPQDPQVETFRQNFADYLRESKGMAPEARAAVWEKFVEAPHPDFFRVVWGANPVPAAKQKKLENYLAKLDEVKDPIQSLLTEFPALCEKQIARFRETFPHARLDEKIIGGISPNFDALTTRLPDGKPALYFGLDSVIAEKANLPVLFSHELFHLYHAERSGIDRDGDIPDAPLTIKLWSEGLATLAAAEQNPQAPTSEIFASEALGNFPASRLQEVAKAFLPFAARTVGDKEARDPWFRSNATPPDGLPPRIGYWLGYEVAKELRASHRLADMAHWPEGQAEAEINAVLVQLTDSP